MANVHNIPMNENINNKGECTMNIAEMNPIVFIIIFSISFGLAWRFLKQRDDRNK